MLLRFLVLQILLSALQGNAWARQSGWGGRRLNQSPAPGPPDAPWAVASGGGGGAGPGGATQLPAGIPKSYPKCNEIDDYPSSPQDVKPFTQPFKQAPIKGKSGTDCTGASCMDVYESEEMYVPDYELVPRSICPGGTKMLTYDGIFPGPTIVQQVGRKAMHRFTNTVDVNQPGNPYGDTDKPWGIGKSRHNMCQERAERTGNPNPGTGRAFTVHHHGMTALAPFDGWAEDVHCYGEHKDYILPGNIATHFWYHDHALATTSENAYAGLEASYIVRPCSEPYNLQNVPQYIVHFLDVVLDGQCQMVYDKDGAHFDNLWGDINTVNGVAWPVLTVQPRYVRFRIVNGAIARALQLSFEDATGKRYNDRCRIVGSDGGVIGKDRTGNLGGRAFPTKRGLFTSNAYRWDIVCDFRGLEGSLYLTNEPNDNLMKPVPPMWCNSHLLMRIDVSASKEPSKPLFPVDTKPSTFNDPAYMADYTQLPGGTVIDKEIGEGLVARLTQKALNGYYDRQYAFKKQEDYWVISGKNWGWTHNIDNHPTAVGADPEQLARDAQFGSHLAATDVGQNFVEVWEYKSGGGWVHPVHAHLIQFYILAINGKPVYESYPELWQVPKDSIQVGRGDGKVSVAARYGPSLGRYLFHCHNVVHEDRDMMMAYSVVPPGLAQKTAAATGFDAEIAKLFTDVGGTYNNGQLNARYGDRFYPAPADGTAAPGSSSPALLPLMQAAKEWNSQGFYNSFYTLGVPEWAVQPCN